MMIILLKTDITAIIWWNVCRWIQCLKFFPLDIESIGNIMSINGYLNVKFILADFIGEIYNLIPILKRVCSK